MHRLTEIDPVAKTAICSECGPTTVKHYAKGKRKDGTQRRGWRCQHVITLQTRRRERPFLRVRANKCSRCPKTHDNPSFFDNHHKDGDHANEDPSNWEWLCPNCHREEHLTQETPEPAT